MVKAKFYKLKLLILLATAIIPRISIANLKPKSSPNSLDNLSKLDNYNFSDLNSAKNSGDLENEINLAKKERLNWVLDKLQEEKAQFVLFTFCDLLGNLKEITVPIDSAKSALKDGLTFDSSSLDGYNMTDESDMLLKPDLSSLKFIPWTEGNCKTAWLMCTVYITPTKAFEADPRYILEKAISELEELGYSAQIGPELEFFMYKKNSDDTITPVDAKKYFSPETNLNRQQENYLILQALKSLGVPVEKIHHEVAPGQFEISLKYGPALSIADYIMVSKHALKSLAKQISLDVTFMPKPFANVNGSGMHLHYSLIDQTGRNIFYDPNSAYNLSDIACAFISGNLKYIKEVSCLFNPTVNSYKRLIPGFEAPIYICWGIKNRSTLIRLPLLHTAPEKGMRAEIRCPDGTANPYLTLAALIKTGIAGIKENLSIMQPTEDNLFNLELVQIKNRNIRSLPLNLGEAVHELKNSVIAQEILGKKAHTELVKLKEKEWRNFNLAITNWELNQYL